MIDEDGFPLGEMIRQAVRPDPETRLFASVILQALKDASNSSLRQTYIHDEAVRWLTEGGRDFQTVCELAGVSSEWVQERCRGIARTRIPDLRGRKSHSPKPQKDKS